MKDHLVYFLLLGHFNECHYLHPLTNYLKKKSFETIKNIEKIEKKKNQSIVLFYRNLKKKKVTQSIVNISIYSLILLLVEDGI